MKVTLNTIDKSINQFYFSAFGSVYVWGSGIDGQLGLGDKVLFLSTPKRLKDQNLQRKVTYIAAGESYSAAITGLLLSWQHTFQKICVIRSLHFMTIFRKSYSAAITDLLLSW